MKSMNVVEISCYYCTYSSNSLYYENYVFLCWQMGQWCEVEVGQWKCKPNTHDNHNYHCQFQGFSFHYLNDLFPLNLQ